MPSLLYQVLVSVLVLNFLSVCSNSLILMQRQSRLLYGYRRISIDMPTSTFFISRHRPIVVVSVKFFLTACNSSASHSVDRTLRSYINDDRRAAGRDWHASFSAQRRPRCRCARRDATRRAIARCCSRRWRRSTSDRAIGRLTRPPTPYFS